MVQFLPLLNDAAAAPAQGGGMSFLMIMVVYIVVIGGAMYFISFRPQKKQQKKMDAMLSTMETGDSILTTSGFYGVVIDIMDEIVIVEFGNNKNCRIPMKKSAIVEVEKASDKASI